MAKAVVKPKTGPEPATPNPNKNNDLEAKTVALAAPPKQFPLDLGIEIERDIGGVEMGVLENGMPYLTQRGLVAVTLSVHW